MKVLRIEYKKIFSYYDHVKLLIFIEKESIRKFEFLAPYLFFMDRKKNALIPYLDSEKEFIENHMSEVILKAHIIIKNKNYSIEEEMKKIEKMVFDRNYCLLNIQNSMHGVFSKSVFHLIHSD